MKIEANDIKVGNILEHKNELWKVIKPPIHTKPGKGPAYIQVEMKGLKNGNKLNERFSSSENIEKAELDQREFQFLYFESGKPVFMDKENFEQISLVTEIFGDKLPFLKDNMIVTIEFYGDTPLSAVLPSTIIDEIIETDPVIKGATVTSSYKYSIISCGVRVMVPPYLTVGEKIVVKTEDSSFVERAK